MGRIVGAAIVSHHPGLMRSKEERLKLGQGRDSDLIEGFERLRKRMDAVKPDTFVIFDTHWITTGRHLVAGADHYKGLYTSTEMPHILSRVPYDYAGAPELARLVEQVATERGVTATNITEPTLSPQYATLNVLAKLGRGERVLSVGTCQTASMRHYLQMGEVIAEAIRRSDANAMLLASGALSHVFNDFDYEPRNQRYYHPDNVADARWVEFDREIVDLMREGRHADVLDRYPTMRQAHYEGWGAHYLQMVAAIGGRDCHARGTPCSEYENAAGTGNIHVWFDLAA
ncbi:MAG TPA: hypothetical protein VEU47_00360 [Candidatus Cybelea sp.]|nr:hypothetical protein [Candidatus Cybelea sp.]